MSRKHLFFLLLICILGFTLRFYRLGDVPVGFHRDEAFLGYNAYSLLKTGRDMSGKLLPLHFESFIYSPGGYSYLTIPAIILFGLNEFSVRFPAAFLGVLTVPLVFFLTRKLFPKGKISVPFLSAFFVAIIPWHINLSRASAESIPVVFFISLGVYLFIQWIKIEKTYLLFFSFLSFLITVSLYQAPRAFLPLFIPLLIVTMISLRDKKKIITSSIFYIFLIILPVIIILATPTLSTRMRTVGIWSTQETKLLTEEQIREDGISGVTPFFSRVVHNKFIGFSEAFIKNYFLHLSYNFLFTDSGYPDRYRVPNAGLLYLSLLPLLVFGFAHVFLNYTKQAILLTGWILLAIVGSALTFDDIPNLQRTVLVFPALPIIMSFGVQTIIQKKYKKIGLCIIAGLLLFLSFECYRYLHHYYIQQIVHRPWYRQEGYKELVTTVENVKDDYQRYIITNRESAPAIFFLFFTKYDPKKFQDETRSSSFRDFDRINFSNYTFSTEECPLKEVQYTDVETQKLKTDCYAEPNTLYVNSGLCETPTVCANILHTVKRKDNTSVFVVMERSQAAASLSGSTK